MNESDVREDIAVPMLRALGYATGTSNDIIREKSLAYEKNFLGRKKKTDHPLRGRADYVLTVLGAGSWTLEIKGEDVEIDRDAIEQAITYARHPQVSGAYAAILNGRRFVAYHNSQQSTDAPLLDLQINTPEALAAILQSVFSPAAIRRDCSPPKVDLNLPLADGYRSSVLISNGVIAYDSFFWRSNLSLPKDARDHLDESCRRMSGLRVSAIGGSIKRDSQSRIRAQLDWALPHDDFAQFARQKDFLDIQYISLGSTISVNRESPTVFHALGTVTINTGDTLFDVATWKTKISDIDAVMHYSGQATGFLCDGIFKGSAEAKYELRFPAIPQLEISQHGTGKFEFRILP